MSAVAVLESFYGYLTNDGKSWVSDDAKRTPCPFLRDGQQESSCAIYEVRPEGCRLYPFETDFGRQGVDCPGASAVFEALEDEDT